MALQSFSKIDEINALNVLYSLDHRIASDGQVLVLGHLLGTLFAVSFTWVASGFHASTC